MWKRFLGRDRRRGQRYWCNTSVRVISGGSRVDARGVRISESGMCLFALTDLPVGSRVMLEFASPDSGEPVRLPASIRHRAVYLYGVEFAHTLAQAVAAD